MPVTTPFQISPPIDKAPSLTGPVALAQVAGSSALTITGATQTASFPVLNMTQTWNNAGVTFTGVKLNITDSASAGGSTVMDLQVDGSSQLIVKKDAKVGFQATSGNNTLMYAAGNGGVFFGASTGTLYGGFPSAGVLSLGSSSDVILTRTAPNTLQFGAADAISPVAQIHSFQSAAGQSNTAGAVATFIDSGGTGNASSGGFVFKVHPAGASGTSQNAAAAALTINGDKSATFAGTVTIGAAALQDFGSGQLGVNNAYYLATAGFVLTSKVVGFNTAFGAAADTALSRVSAGVVGVGTGAAGSTAGTIQASGFLPTTDNGSDVGASATRIRNIYLATSATLSANCSLAWSDVSMIRGAAGVIGISGQSSAFPGLKPSSSSQAAKALLQVRLADDSDYAGLECKYVRLKAVPFSSLPAANDAGLGARALITDAANVSFNTSASGGGGSSAPVYSNGSSWLYG